MIGGSSGLAGGGVLLAAIMAAVLGADVGLLGSRELRVTVPKPSVFWLLVPWMRSRLQDVLSIERRKDFRNAQKPELKGNHSSWRHVSE